MSSLPESSAAAYLAVLNDPLFRQIKDVYSFFKQPTGTKGKNITPEELAAYNEAYAAILRAERGPALVAQVWDDLSQPQRELLLELLLKQYCDSRADPEDKTLPVRLSLLALFHPLSRHRLTSARNSSRSRRCASTSATRKRRLSSEGWAQFPCRERPFSCPPTDLESRACRS